MATILVTGALGFIGRYVMRRFSEHGNRVIGIGHENAHSTICKTSGPYRWVAADVTQQVLFGLAEQPDIIVHCAGTGSVGPSFANPYEDFKKNVQTAIAVLEFGRRQAANARIVMLSSAAVYGESRRLPITESSALQPASPYGTHKRIVEELSKAYGSYYGLSIAIIRLFSVYGPGLRRQLLWDACQKFALENTQFDGSGDELRDWLHAEDAARLIAITAGKASSAVPIVNGGTGIATKVRDALGLLRKAWPTPLPALLFSGSHRVGDPPGYQADIEIARSWGWQPKHDIEAGIAEYARWFQTAAL